MVVYVYRYRCRIVRFTSHVMLILGSFPVFLPITLGTYRWITPWYESFRSHLTAGALSITDTQGSLNTAPICSTWVP